MLQCIFPKKMSLGASRGGSEQFQALSHFLSLCSIPLQWEGEEVLTELFSSNSRQLKHEVACLSSLHPFVCCPLLQITGERLKSPESGCRGWIRCHRHHAYMAVPFALQPSTPCKAKPLVRSLFAPTFGCQLGAPRALHLEGVGTGDLVANRGPVLQIYSSEERNPINLAPFIPL